MAERAKHIELRIGPDGDSLFVNGEEFPYDILADDIEVSSAEGQAGLVRVTLLADAVSVKANLARPFTLPAQADEQDWHLGHQFEFDADREPPSNVQVLAGIGEEESELPYFVRCSGGWAWSDTKGLPDADSEVSADPWPAWNSGWKGVLFEVVKVSE